MDLWKKFTMTRLQLPANIWLLLTPRHCRHIPTASPSPTSSLMNHFTCSSNATHGKQRHDIRRITNLLIFAFTRTKHHIISDFQHLRRLPGFHINRIDTSRRDRQKRVQGQVSVSPVTESMYSQCHKGVICVK